METVKELINRLNELISGEEYGKALNIIDKEVPGILKTLPASPVRRDLLMLLARVYFHNRDIDKTNRYVDELASTYPEIEKDIEYIIIKRYLLHKEGKDDDALKILSRTLKRNWGDSDFHRVKLRLGMAHFWCGNYIEANHNLQSCYRYYLSSMNNIMLGRTLYMLGYIAFQRSFLDVAGSYLEKAIEHFAGSESLSQLGSAHQLMSILSYRIGNYEESIKHSQLAKECFEKCDHDVEIINSSISRARASMFIGEYANAADILKSCYNDSKELEYKRGVALSAEFLGEIYYNRREYEKSLRWLKEAEKLSVEIAPRGDIAVEVYRRLGDVYIATGEIEEAEECLVRARDIADHLGDRYEMGTILRAYGLLAAKKEDIDLARSFFDEAVVTLSMIKESFERAGTHLVAAEEYRVWGERPDISSNLKRQFLRDARAEVVEALHLYTSLGLEEKVKHCESVIFEIEESRGYREEETREGKLEFRSDWLYQGIMVARDEETRRVISKVEDLAPGDIPVLITGETGTGKEVVARLLHRLSERSDGPFVGVNCASVPDDIFESEFFGHVRGAFTGAVRDRVGYLEQADGGTLFLDEVSELSDNQQAKLLRVLEEREVRRVGGTKDQPVDIRLISASNRDVDELLDEKCLREDFYYRICAEVIELKALRERREDVPALFAYYMDEFGDGLRVEDGLMELLCQYHWPGNVRELVNVTRTLYVLGRKRKVIRISDIPARIRSMMTGEVGMDAGRGPEDSVLRMLRSGCGSGSEEVRRLIESSLDKHDGNKSAVARELGISRNTLYRRLRELKID